MRFVRARWWVAAAALVAFAPGVRLWHHFNPPAPLHAGDRLAPIALSSLSGSGYTLAPSGHPQLINIFATWCTPCRDEMPDLALAAERLRERGVEVIGIDQSESGPAVARFVKEFGVRFPVYIDTTGITHRVLGARFIPTTIYVDRDGRIRWIRPGPLTAREFTTFARIAEDAG